MELSRVWVSEPQTFGFYAVADGMGGHDAGEVASRLALETLSSWVLQQVAEPWMLSAPLPSEEVGRRLLQGVERAHQRVRDGTGEEGERDMGTTLTAAIIVDGLAYVVNVGDSRTYLFRGEPKTLRQVSHDHSVVQELVDRGELAPEDVYTDPRRNVILASLGAPSEVSGVDLFVEAIGPSDKLLLCSDGLWEMVYDDDLATIMERTNDPQQCAEDLVLLACQHGGVDNVTAVVVQVQDRPVL
jgi:protein phosphatase